MTDTTISMTRRRAIAASVGLAGGSAALWYRSQEPVAAVQMDGFAVADEQFTEPTVPVLDVALTLSWDLSQSVTDIVIGLVVDGEQLASEALNTSQQTADYETSLAARLDQHSALSASDFEDGETTVDVRATVDILNDGETVAQASAEDTATVSVTGGTVSLAGSGEFVAGE